MKVKDFLSESKWTKGYYARRANLSPVPPDSDEAICFCIEGAQIHLKIPNQIQQYNTIVAAAFELFPDRMKACDKGNQVAYFNDHPCTTFEDVRRVLEKADV